MSPRLDLPIAVFVWLAGFACVRTLGTWLPLATLTALAAVRLLATDVGSRELLRRAAPAAMALGLAAGAAMVVVTYALYGPAVTALPRLEASTRELYHVLRAERLDVVSRGAVLLVVAACEEIIWRGRALTAAAAGSRNLAGAAVPVGTVALLYGAALLASGSWLLAAVGTACGFAWGLLRVRTGSLWPAVVAHAAWDLAVLVVWPLA